MSRSICSVWTGIYLNAYVPNLQVGGQVVSFLTAHLGNPIPSPAIFEKIGTAFRRAVRRFADEEHIPMLRFAKNDRKIETARLAAAHRDPLRQRRSRGNPAWARPAPFCPFSMEA